MFPRVRINDDDNDDLGDDSFRQSATLILTTELNKTVRKYTQTINLQ